MDNSTQSTPALLPQDPIGQISALPYTALDESKDEIRLITFLPQSHESDLIHCTLETVSLKSFSPDYRKYIATSTLPMATKRKTLVNWTREIYPPKWWPRLEKGTMDNHVAPIEGYCFTYLFNSGWLMLRSKDSGQYFILNSDNTEHLPLFCR